MNLPIVLREEAEAEFDKAFDWYDEQRPGLGTVFVEAVQKIFDAIAARPLMHAIVFADIRRAVVRRFPFCVYYRAHPDRVEVIAVFHSRRNPSIWQGRI